MNAVPPSATKRVVILCSDLIGPAMAGPGIRYTALAEVLGREFEVLLAAPEGSQPVSGPFQLHVYAKDDHDKVYTWCRTADALLFPGDVLLDFPDLALLGKPIIVDGYDPHTAEALWLTCTKPMEARLAIHSHRQRLLTQQCLIGDFFICAGEVQRTWWLGLLEMTGRVNPYTFGEDPTLRKLVDCVPYGLPSAPPPPVPEDFRPFIDLHPADPILLWGGGLWDWLDPLTAIQALPKVLKHIPNARLLFPGTRHPTPSVPAMRMVERAEKLAHSLGLLNTHIFFGDWISRDVWPNYLQRAAVGLSLHPDSYETHLAFRSRVLEYIWAGLPMVITGGDETALLVQRYGLGRVVAAQDVEDVTEAIVQILTEPKERYAAAFARAQADLTWENAAKPLIAFCRAPRIAPDKVSGVGRGNALFAGQVETLRRELESVQGQYAEIHARIVAYEREMAETQALIAAYERGRFIRLMRWLKERIAR